MTAFGLHRLEATAPWGVEQGRQAKEKVTPSDKRISPTDLAHFARDCWLGVEGISELIPLTGEDCFSLAGGTSFDLRDSQRTRLRCPFPSRLYFGVDISCCNGVRRS